MHPDGEISFFNDASFGIAPSWKDLTRYAASVGVYVDKSAFEGGVTLNMNPMSGLHSFQWGSESKAIIDTGNVGPNYQPGHAHADSLSFELSVHGQRLFVNSGTSQYGEGPERARQRGTAAHNTIQIEGENSSEVWSGFRVARRATCAVHSSGKSTGRAHVRASHNGYARLSCKAIHTREWVARSHTLLIHDEISGRCDNIVSRLYLHPDVNLYIENKDITATLPSGKRVTITFRGDSDISILPSTWHPEFGKSTPNECIQLNLSGNSQLISIHWTD